MICKLMKECYRVLKLKGWAILQVPISPTLAQTYEDDNFVSEADREREFGQRDHVRIYAFDYVDRLKSVGFRVEQFDWQAESSAFRAKHNPYGLNPAEKIFIAHKD
ncbi:MAG: hypothetical protein HON04_16880 [Planctomicrobium sp.]|jgi:predicted SAM-dependent methyltransferase|nr:hypothetical protein [Planctomicrobium sp.]